jgi:hypothetical protein
MFIIGYNLEMWEKGVKNIGKKFFLAFLGWCVKMDKILG